MVAATSARSRVWCATGRRARMDGSAEHAGLPDLPDGASRGRRKARRSPAEKATVSRISDQRRLMQDRRGVRAQAEASRCQAPQGGSGAGEGAGQAREDDRKSEGGAGPPSGQEHEGGSESLGAERRDVKSG